MAQISQAEFEQTKRITDAIEEARLRLQKIANSLTALVKAGKATCEELRAYNLWALSIYGENKAMLSVARANGATGIPLLPPTPTLFAYRGVPGERAGDFPCGKPAGSLSGALSQALSAPDEGNFISPNAVEIIPAGAPVNPAEGPKLTTITNQLGLPVWVIIVAGIAISALAAIAAIASWRKQQEITERTVTVANNNLKVFEQASAYRAACIAECSASGANYNTCASKCASAFPIPQMTFPGGGASGGLGLVGWALIGAGVIVGGRFAWKKWREGRDEG